MPQKTSFCNRTLLRSDLRHFWPAGFVYVLIWLMILPIQLLRVGYDAPRGNGLLADKLEALLHNVIVDASVGSLVLAVVCGVVIPMAVYAYLMTPRSVGMMHALPVKRTTQYFSHFLAGFGLLTAGNLLIFLLSVLAQLPFGMVDWSSLGQWLLLTELLELFFLSLGALCAMATGWLLAIPVLYVTVNFAALLLCNVVQFLQRWFYFGFQYTTYPPFVQWLTPIMKLTEDVGFLNGEHIARNGIGKRRSDVRLRKFFRPSSFSVKNIAETLNKDMTRRKHIGQFSDFLRVSDGLIERVVEVVGNKNGKICVVGFKFLVGVTVDYGKIVVIVFLADKTARILAESANLVLERLGIADELRLVENVVDLLHDLVSYLDAHADIDCAGLMGDIMLSAELFEPVRAAAPCRYYGVLREYLYVLLALADIDALAAVAVEDYIVALVAE